MEQVKAINANNPRLSKFTLPELLNTFLVAGYSCTQPVMISPSMTFTTELSDDPANNLRVLVFAISRIQVVAFDPILEAIVPKEGKCSVSVIMVLTDTPNKYYVTEVITSNVVLDDTTHPTQYRSSIIDLTVGMVTKSILEVLMNGDSDLVVEQQTENLN